MNISATVSMFFSLLGIFGFCSLDTRGYVREVHSQDHVRSRVRALLSKTRVHDPECTCDPLKVARAAQPCSLY